MQIVSSPPPPVYSCFIVVLYHFISFIYYCVTAEVVVGPLRSRQEINSAKHEEPAGGIYGVVRSEEKTKRTTLFKLNRAKTPEPNAANSREPSEAETGGSRNRCGRFCISSCFALKKGKKKKKTGKKLPVWPRTPLTPPPPPHPSFRRHQRGGNLENCL